MKTPKSNRNVSKKAINPIKALIYSALESLSMNSTSLMITLQDNEFCIVKILARAHQSMNGAGIDPAMI